MSYRLQEDRRSRKKTGILRFRHKYWKPNKLSNRVEGNLQTGAAEKSAPTRLPSCSIRSQELAPTRGCPKTGIPRFRHNQPAQQVLPLNAKSERVVSLRRNAETVVEGRLEAV